MEQRDSLTPQELADLLEIIARAIRKEPRKEPSATLNEIELFTREVLARRGLRSQTPEYGWNVIDKILSSFKHFRTVESLRLFLQVALGMPLPYRMSKENLINLGVGAFIRSNVSVEEAEKRWNEREKKLGSIDIYKIEKKSLVDLLESNSLFPDGYAIVSFAGRFRINLPLLKDKKTLINLLLTRLYESPRSSEEIGYYGVEKRRRPNDVR